MSEQIKPDMSIARKAGRVYGYNPPDDGLVACGLYVCTADSHREIPFTPEGVIGELNDNLMHHAAAMSAKDARIEELDKLRQLLGGHRDDWKRMYEAEVARIAEQETTISILTKENDKLHRALDSFDPADIRGEREEARQRIAELEQQLAGAEALMREACIEAFEDGEVHQSERYADYNSTSPSTYREISPEEGASIAIARARAARTAAEAAKAGEEKAR